MRCLEPAAPTFAVDAREVWQPNEARAHQARTPGADRQKQRVDDDELVSPYVEEGVLDLHGWARDALALAVPANLLCREDCAGLCPVCGVNLNEAGPDHHHEREPDPRWAALSELGSSSRCAQVRRRRGRLCTLRRATATLPAMAVPKQKQSHARTTQRRSQHKISAPTYNACPQCHSPRLPAPGVPGVRQLQGPRGHRSGSGRAARLRAARRVVTVAVDAGGADLGPREVAAGAARAAADGIGVLLFGPAGEIGDGARGRRGRRRARLDRQERRSRERGAHDAGGVDRPGDPSGRRGPRPGVRVGRLDRAGAGRRAVQPPARPRRVPARARAAAAQPRPRRRSCCSTSAPT